MNQSEPPVPPFMGMDHVADATSSDEPSHSSKSVEDVAAEVLRGEWGVGQERRMRLAKAGFNPNLVQEAIIKLKNS